MSFSLPTIPDEVWRALLAGGVWAAGLIGILLTALTLPGIWLMLFVAGLAQWYTLGVQDQQMFSWWTLGVCVGLAIIAEIVEGFASAFGASKAGGSKKAALASVLGAIVGAILGTFIMPVVGTVIGAALGAGAAALATEKQLGRKTWADAGRVGTGAALGRLVASMLKVGFAVLVALILGIDAIV